LKNKFKSWNIGLHFIASISGFSVEILSVQFSGEVFIASSTWGCKISLTFSSCCFSFFISAISSKSFLGV